MYQSLFQIAQDVAQNQVHSGAYVSPDDTVCVICSGNNRVYTGVNRIEMRDGRQVNIHAEITAMQNMQAAGESVITAMLLIKTYSRSPMLPCNGCIRYILSLSPENVNCKVALPDRMMPITEIGKPQQPAGNSNNFMGAAPYPQGMQMSGSHASSSVPYQGASPVSMMNGFSGSIENIELICHNSLYQDLLDRFGTRCIRKYNDEYLSVKFTGAVSSGLVSWILQYGDKIYIKHPQVLKSMYNNKLNDVTVFQSKRDNFLKNE